MKKEMKWYKTLTKIVIILLVLIVVGGAVYYIVFLSGGCRHSGKHYHYNAATESKTGNREYYYCNKCKNTYLTTPSNGSWNEAEQTSELDITHVAYLPKTGDMTVSSKTIPIYGTGLTPLMNISLYSINGEEIPYVDSSFVREVITGVFGTSRVQETFPSESVQKFKYLTSKHDYAEATIDYKNSEIYFSNYSKFCWAEDFGYTSTDISYKGTSYLSPSVGEMSETFSSDSRTIKLKDYSIYFLSKKEGSVTKNYMPISILGSVFLSNTYMHIICNGDAAWFTAQRFEEFDEPTKQKFFQVTRTTKTPSLCAFMYKEMCLAFDLFYGLKSEYGITSTFDDFCTRKGLKSSLQSSDPVTNSDALTKFTYVLGDIHTSLNVQSPMVGPNYEGPSLSDPSSRVYQISVNYYSYLGSRKQGWGIDGQIPPIYIEKYNNVDNTMFISFDNFKQALNSNSYHGLSESSKEQLFENGDTVGLFYKANKLLRTTYTGVKNIVIDLSCNTGGVVNTGKVIESWVNGCSELYTKAAIDGALSYTKYYADVNLDGSFNSQDYLDDSYKVYVMVSNASFSCGNLVPFQLKKGTKTKIIATNNASTFGGTCPVGYLPLADGTCLGTSSNTIFGNYDGSNFTNFESPIAIDLNVAGGVYYNRAKLVQELNK